MFLVGCIFVRQIHEAHDKKNDQKMEGIVKAAVQSTLGLQIDSFTGLTRFKDPKEDSERRQHCGTHPSIIVGFQDPAYKGWRELQYMKLRDLVRFPSDTANDLSCCNGSRHRSVAWANIKLWILQSLNVEADVRVLCPESYTTIPCFQGSGSPCSECTNNEHMRQFFIDEFKELFGM